jgi:Tol biopolymer transport system component
LLFKGTGGDFSKPKWSPDGRRLIFSRRLAAASDAAALIELVVVTGGDDPVRVLPVPDQILFHPSDWANDGRTILGTCRPRVDEPAKICVTTLSETATEAAVTVVASDTVKGLWNGHFSPDQRWIVFQAIDPAEQGTSTLFVVSASGGPWTPVSIAHSFADKPHWSPDGRSIYFLSDRGGRMNVWGQRFSPESGRPIAETFRVTSFASDTRMLSTNLRAMEIAVTPNHLLLPITESTGQLWMLEHPAR